MNKKKIVLAFSGGLDTSFCTWYLGEEKGFEVHTVVVNTGGFDQEELKVIEEKAIRFGSVRHTTIDASREYYQKCIKYLIFGNVLRNRNYPVSVSSERTFQSFKILEYAQKENIKYIAHGSTGAGNDQVRFESVFQIMAPEIRVVAPIRELSISREEEIEYLEKAGLSYRAEKSNYSINKGLWGTSVGGRETLTSGNDLPEEAWLNQLEAKGTENLTIGFSKGEPVSINDQYFDDPVGAYWPSRKDFGAICGRPRHSRGRNDYWDQGQGRFSGGGCQNPY